MLAFTLTWNIDPVIVELGPFAIRYYGLIFLGVFLGGYALYRWQVLRGGGTEDDATDVFVPGILGVLIGSRLGHVFFYEPGRFLEDPLWIFEIWKGGLASHGATIGLLVAMWYYARRHRQSYLEVIDRFAFSAALGATLVRLGNFFNSEIVGRVTDGTWGVRFPRYDRITAAPPRDPFSWQAWWERLPHYDVESAVAPLRHPTQLYEFALGLFVMASLYVTDRLLGREQRPRGAMISTFFAVYFTGRFVVEFWKEYQTLSTSFPLTMGQILSIPAALAGYAGLVWSIRRGQTAGWNTAPATPDTAASRAARRRKQRKRR